MADTALTRPAELKAATDRCLTARDFFAEAVEYGDPDRPFIYFQNTTTSYGDIHSASLRIAQALNSLDIGPGARVVTMMPNTPEAVALILGIAASGASYVPIIRESTSDEVKYFLEDCGASAAIFDRDSWTRVGSLTEDAGIEHVFLFGAPPAGGTGEAAAPRYLGDFAAGFEPVGEGLPPIEPKDELCLMYTSGSTGRPKGVILAQEAFAASGYVNASCWGCGPDDVILCTLPLFHVGGAFMCIGPAVACKGGLMLQERFSVSSFWDDVDYSGATAGVLMPAMMAMLKANATGPRENTLRTTLTHYIDQEFVDLYDIDTLTTWSMSELAGIGAATGAHFQEKDRPNVVGWKAHESVELQIVDEEGEPLPVGELGEIVCRHPWTLTRYLNLPEETARTIRDGWVFSGDLGWLDEAGVLYYIGRKKNMIKRAGENVSALEVEKVIRDHPAIEDCACFAVPDPIRTEEVKAVVVAMPGKEIDEGEVVRWCSKSLSAFKVPRYIEIRDTMPRTSTQKPDLARMKAEHEHNSGWDREAATAG